MYITARLDYATRALLVLAATPDDELVTAESIAAQQHLPAKFAENILGELRHAGLVVGRRGNLGGFRLTRPACSITIADICTALNIRIAEVHAPSPSLSSNDDPGDVASDVWTGLQDAVKRILESVTLAHLLAEPVSNAALSGQGSKR